MPRKKESAEPQTAGMPAADPAEDFGPGQSGITPDEMVAVINQLVGGAIKTQLPIIAEQVKSELSGQILDALGTIRQNISQQLPDEVRRVIATEIAPSLQSIQDGVRQEIAKLQQSGPPIPAESPLPANQMPALTGHVSMFERVFGPGQDGLAKAVEVAKLFVRPAQPDNDLAILERAGGIVEKINNVMGKLTVPSGISQDQVNRMVGDALVTGIRTGVTAKRGGVAPANPLAVPASVNLQKPPNGRSASDALAELLAMEPRQ